MPPFWRIGDYQHNFGLRRLGYPGRGGQIPSYSSILINDFGASEVWPLVDIDSGTTVFAKVSSARNGTLQGLDLQNADGPVPGTLAPYFDGVNDYVNIITASLQSIFDLDKGAVFGWSKASGSGIWTDGSGRFIMSLQYDGVNYFRVAKSTSNNTMELSRRDSTGLHRLLYSPFSSTNWFSWGISWDTVADELKFFINGSQVGATLTGLGNWGGHGLVTALIGAVTTVPAQVWSGWLAYPSVWFGSVPTPTDFSNMTVAAAISGPE